MKTTAAYQTETAGMEPAIAEERGITATLRREYLRQILAGNRTPALEVILAAYHGGYPLMAIYMDIFQEALYEVGRLWESNQISVADEHMATAITQYVLANLYQYLECGNERRGRLIITGVQGELHQIGANMVADVLEADGWDARFLGVNVPHKGVIESIGSHRADLLGISSTMFANIPKVIQLVEATRSEFGDSVRIILGGGAFRGQQTLPQGLERCIVAQNLREALDLTGGIFGAGR